ncbi:MAG: glycosyltransferase family 2 protein [Patescibacteria group bacterium]
MSKFKKRKDVLVLIPAYNEADTIEELIVRAKKYCDVCVINDASTDKTEKIVKSMRAVKCISHKKNTHIPQAILDGMKYALSKKYKYIITMDAGLSHNPDELKNFIAFKKCDLLLSYRIKTKAVPLYRKFLSKAGTILYNVTLNPFFLENRPYLIDFTSGYRRYSKKAVRYLLSKNMKARSFDFHTESASYIYRNKNLSILQTPISYNYSNSSLNMRVLTDSIRMLLIIALSK